MYWHFHLLLTASAIGEREGALPDGAFPFPISWMGKRAFRERTSSLTMPVTLNLTRPLLEKLWVKGSVWRGEGRSGLGTPIN